MHFPGEDELASFPLVDDFSVQIADHLVEFRSARRGRLAGFPAWEHADRDLLHFTAADVPLGTYDDPYDDADEAWHLVLFEHGGFVYVLEGDAPRSEDFPRFFRVPRDRYFAAWAALIDAHNPVTPLDEP
jgi:hypothetical protein